MTQFLSTIPEPFHINWHLNFGAVSVGHEDAVSCLRLPYHLPVVVVLLRCRAFGTMTQFPRDDFQRKTTFQPDFGLNARVVLH